MDIRGRALHFVFKIPERPLTSHFYRNILGMKVLRHEEFSEGCAATCNGPYDNRWSKTMIGYGAEDNHFVIELTYNYNVESYDLGNDFIAITINSSEVLQRAKKHNWPILSGGILEAPGGYRFIIKDTPQSTNRDPVEKVTLASTNLQSSLNYWHNILGLKVFEQSEKSISVGFNKDEVKLELQKIAGPLDRAQAYGRIAFSCPYEQQPEISEKVKAAKQTILNDLISLDTPGKATVRVVILADPDGHQICFVDDESYRKLSQVDPKGEELLDRYIRKHGEHLACKKA